MFPLVHSKCLNWSPSRPDFCVEKRTIEERTACGSSPLHFAILNQNLDLVRAILQARPETVRAINNKGETPLHWACTQTDNPLLPKLLLLHGADVNQADEVGNTPLHWAAQADNITVLPYLISAGADVNEINEEYLTPIDLAVIHGAQAVVEFLLPISEDMDDLLYLSCEHGEAGIAELLVNSGLYSVKSLDHPDSPLHVAIAKQHADCVRVLMSFCYDPKRRASVL